MCPDKAFGTVTCAIVGLSCDVSMWITQVTSPFADSEKSEVLELHFAIILCPTLTLIVPLTVANQQLNDLVHSTNR